MVIAIGFQLCATYSSGLASDERVLWQSEPPNQKSLSRDIAGLYLKLYEQNALPQQQVIATSSESIEKIMRDKHLFFGEPYPIELDALLCRLNSVVCRGPIGGTGISRWNIKVGDTLTLPNIKFTPYETPQLYHLKKGENVADVVTSVMKGCDTFDEICRDGVLNLNKGDKRILDGTYEGVVVLPALSVRTTLESVFDLLRLNQLIDDAQKVVKAWQPKVGLDNFSRETGMRLDLKPLRFGFTSVQPMTEIKAAMPVNPIAGWKPPVQQFRNPDDSVSEAKSLLNKVIRRDEVLRSLHGNLATGLALDVDAINEPRRPSDEPQFRLQEPLFKLVKHPFYTGDPLSSDPVGIGVFDQRVEAEHPEFADNGTGTKVFVPIVPTPHKSSSSDGLASIPTPPVSAVPKRSQCNDPASPLSCFDEVQAIVERDHGTHVTGIIGAQLNGRGILGISPEASIYTHEIYPQKIITPEEAASLADAIFAQTRAHHIDVFNFSWEYRPIRDENDPVGERIKKLTNVLFVASAGNEGVDKSFECNVFPACLDLLNVLAVAAIQTNDLTLLRDVSSSKGSNYGTKFHIAAPGNSILAPITGGYYGRLSGTSQAAPIVTGAAALLLAEDNKLRPPAVKSRLIYTSDLIPGLQDKLLGGILNIQRALNHRQDKIELVDGRSFTGVLTEKAFSVSFEGKADIPMSDIMRLVCFANSCTLMRKDSGTLTVRKLSQLHLKTSSKPIGMDVIKDSSDPSCSQENQCYRKFMISEVADYTSALQSVY